MGFWDKVKNFGQAVSEGDAEAAVEAAGEAAEDANEAAVDGANAAGDAASDATGGAIDVNVDEDGISGQVGGVSGDLDTDASDGSVGGGVSFEYGQLAGASARGIVDTDPYDGGAGIDIEASARAAEHEAGVNADAGFSGKSRDQAGIRLDGRVDSQEAEFRFQPEAEFSAEVEGGILSHEVGISFNMDIDGERANVEAGLHYESDSGTAEADAKAKADLPQGQVRIEGSGSVEGLDAEGNEVLSEETHAAVGTEVSRRSGTTRISPDAESLDDPDTKERASELRNQPGNAPDLGSESDGAIVEGGGVGVGEDTAAPSDFTVGQRLADEMPVASSNQRAEAIEFKARSSSSTADSSARFSEAEVVNTDVDAEALKPQAVHQNDDMPDIGELADLARFPAVRGGSIEFDATNDEVPESAESLDPGLTSEYTETIDTGWGQSDAHEAIVQDLAPNPASDVMPVLDTTFPEDNDMDLGE